MSKPNCQIHLHRSFGFFFRRVRGKGLPIDQVAKELVADSFTQGWGRSRRVVERVLSQFPWEASRDEVWCGVHPLLDASPQVTGTKAWTLQVAPAHAPEVLRTLMPIARQLGVSVAVPYFNFFVDAAAALAEREVYPEKTVAKYDPNWNQPLDVPRAKAQLYEGMTAMFAPLGFVPAEGTINLLSLDRSLDGGRSIQRVFVDQGYGVGFKVFSGLLREIKQRIFENANFRLEHSDVVNVSLLELREHADKSWEGEDATSCWMSEEVVNLALDDIQRLIVPLVNQFTSAKGVFDWYFDPAWAGLNPRSLNDWSGLMKDESRLVWNGQIIGVMREALLMAKLLPDEEYGPLLDDWERKLLSKGDPKPGTIDCLKFAAAYRQLPRLSEGAF